ncbi:MAG TPA: cytochrome c peroxidase [Gammaproteobacteria bacterium]|nr:cytochrome c peroxidase [Gammaproteobacteria bacterium]
MPPRLHRHTEERAARRPLPGAALLALGACALCAPSAAPAQSVDGSLLQSTRNLFGVLEPVRPGALDAPVVTPGRQLFWDERISINGSTAFASCHTRDAWGADARRFSVDARGRLTGRPPSFPIVIDVDVGRSKSDASPQ